MVSCNRDHISCPVTIRITFILPNQHYDSAIFVCSRVNPMFREEGGPSGVRPGEDDRTDWQQSAAGGSTYWHEPPPDSSLQLDPVMDPAVTTANDSDATIAAAAAVESQPDGPPDSLEPPSGSPVAARRFVEYRGAPLPTFSEVAEVHRGPRAHQALSLHRGMDLHRGADLHRGMHVHRELSSGRSSTLPRPVWPSSVGDSPGPEPPRRLSVSGYMTVADHIGSTWPATRQPPPRGADGRFVLERRATFPPARTGFAGRLPSIPDEDIEAPVDGQPDSIVTESLLQLTTPRSTPAGSVRDESKESDSRAGSTTVESFHWEGAGGGVALGGVLGGVSGGVGGGVASGVVGGTAERPPAALPPLAPPPGGFSWNRTLEPLMQVLWSGEESPPVLRRSRQTPGSAGGEQDAEAVLPLPWRGSEAGSVAGSAAGVGHYPAPPSRASSELSQLYAELAAPRPFSRALSEELYAWPVSPPVAVPVALLQRPPTRSESPPPAYLNQLLPSDASDCGLRRSRLGSDASSQQGRGVRRTPSDACSDSSRDSGLSSGSRGSRSRLLPSDSSEGGSERRVTFSADTVDNEPGPGRPRPRRHPDRSTAPGPARGSGRARNKGFYAANVFSRLTGAKPQKTGEKKVSIVQYFPYFSRNHVVHLHRYISFYTFMCG